MWKPNGAVVGNRAPAAVVVQIFVADDIVGDVAGSNDVVFVEIALIAPVIEIIRIRQRPRSSASRVSVPEKEPCLGPGGRVSGATAVDFSFPIANADDSGVRRLR